MSEVPATIGGMNAPPAPLTEALIRLGEAFDDVLRLLCEDNATRTMSDTELLAVTPVAEVVGRRADTLRLIVAGEIAERCDPDGGDQRLSARNGSANAVELLTRLTQIAAFTAKNRMRLAQAVTPSTTFSGELLPPRFPLVRSALATGTMGIDSAAAIVRVLDPIADRVDRRHLQIAEQELVAAATGCAPDNAPAASADETLLQARVWELLLDPDGKLPAYERAMRKRGVTFGKERDGSVPFRGNLMPDVAAQFERLVDAHLNPRVEDRTESDAYASTGLGPSFREVDTGEVDGPVVPHDPRTSAQKRHDVLATVLAVAARSAETPTLGGAAPTLMVMVSGDELLRERGVAIIEGTDCTVPAFVARHIACCGGIQRVIYGDDGRIVELGGPQRVFTAHQRRAITARDGGCIIAGCHVGASWCEVHHVEEHARGGLTHTGNGVLLCWFHHRTLETNGWQIRMVNGVPYTKAPNCVDPYGKWRPATGSIYRMREPLRERMRSG